MKLHAQITLPLLSAVILVVGLTLWGSRIGHTAEVLALCLVAALLVVAAVGFELSVLRPLRVIRRLMREGNEAPPATESTGELAQFSQHLKQLRDTVQCCEVAIKRESQQRERLDQKLREVEERYVLAVERANDGLWEWDLKTGVVEFSPRWKGMLGYLDANLRHIDDWNRLLHPMDRDGVLMRLYKHLDALTPYFDADYRVLHRDGRYRWVLSRGAVIRHASGKPYRIVVMDNDICARKELEDTLIQAAEGLSSTSGMDFFRALIKNLSDLLGTCDNLVCQCLDDPPTRVRTLAYYTKGTFTDNFEYDLVGTSCGAVIARRESVYVPTGVCNTWPLASR